MTELEGGDCFRVAANLTLQLGDRARLIHGQPTLTRPPYIKYDHAWVEVGDEVLDLSNDKAYAISRELYYAVGHIDSEESESYSSEETRSQLLEHEHYGPWK